MFSWKFSWSTVLVLICSPVFWEALSRSFANVALGAASDWLEPKVSVPVAVVAPQPRPAALLDALEPLLPPPQAASSALPPSAAPSPRPPRRTPRRLSAATDGGTIRARYSASD